jgi:hypothetical protein
MAIEAKGSAQFSKTKCRPGPVLRIRIRDPVLFYPLDPGSGSGMDFFRIPDPGSGPLF